MYGDTIDLSKIDCVDVVQVSDEVHVDSKDNNMSAISAAEELSQANKEAQLGIPAESAQDTEMPSPNPQQIDQSNPENLEANVEDNSTLRQRTEYEMSLCVAACRESFLRCYMDSGSLRKEKDQKKAYDKCQETKGECMTSCDEPIVES